jgi:membrane-bound inhibitor of C-type lysozyme
MTTAIITSDPNDAPKADSTRYYKCDGCQHLHVMLMSEEDNVLATAVMSREMLLEMLEVVDGPPLGAGPHAEPRH